MKWIEYDPENRKGLLGMRPDSCLYTDGINFFVLRPTQLLNELRTEEYGYFKPKYYIDLKSIPLPSEEEEKGHQLAAVIRELQSRISDLEAEKIASSKGVRDAQAGCFSEEGCKPGYEAVSSDMKAKIKSYVEQD